MTAKDKRCAAARRIRRQDLEREVERLRVALMHLSNEVLGSLPLMEAQARQDMGNTNYTCLMARAEQARALLAGS